MDSMYGTDDLRSPNASSNGQDTVPNLDDRSQLAQARPQQQRYEYARPVSLGNLLFQRSGAEDEGAVAAKLQDGDEPRSSSPSPSLLSASASIRSVSSSHAAPAQRATKVALPANDRGVRTRVNIVGPPARGPYSNAAERQRPASSSSAHLLSTVAGSGADHQHRSSSDSARYASTSSSSSAITQGEPRRFSNLSHINQTTSASAGHPVFSMLSTANRRVLPEHSAHSTGSHEQAYTFPARLNGQSRQAAHSPGPHTPDHRSASTFPLGHSNNSSSASVHPYTPSGPATGAAGGSVYSTPASSVSRPSPNASVSYSAKAPHLQNLPKSLIPGGYDFSPASASTHESHAQAGNQQTPQGSADTTIPFSFMRDRSASVPRTVSSLGDSERSSSEDFHRQFPIANNGSSAHDSGHAYASNGSDTSMTASRILQNGRASHEGRDSEEAGFTMPQISPVPPKLDLDFGNFSLDFGSSFGSGSLDLTSAFAATNSTAITSKPATSLLGSHDVPSKLLGDMLSLGLGHPPRPATNLSRDDSSVYVEQRTGISQDDEDQPLASLAKPGTTSALGGRTTGSPPLDVKATSVESILEMAPKAVSPLSRLARSASNSSSLTDLTSLTRVNSSIAHGSLDDDRTPKASSATQTTFRQDQQQEHQGSLAPAKPLGHTQSESPVSASGSSMEPSRPASSLLVHHPQQKRLGTERQRLDSFDQSESKRTTLSSYEQHGQHQPTSTSQRQPTLHSSDKSASTRLSVNKTLPAIPGLTVDAANSWSAPQVEPAPAFRRSVSESIVSIAGSDGRGQQKRAGKGSRESQLSNASTSSSLDRQPLHQLSSLQSRSRANTLDQLSSGSGINSADQRGPHGSAASESTMHSMRLERADMGDKAAHTQRLDARSLAKIGRPDKPRPRKYEVWDNGELVKKDAATDKLLASAVAKLEEWMTSASFQVREKAIAMVDEPSRPSLVNMTKASSGLLPISLDRQLSGPDAQPTVTSPVPVQAAKGEALISQKGSSNVPDPTPDTSMPSSFTDKPASFERPPQRAEARLVKPIFESGQETTPEPVAPLRLHTKALRADVPSAATIKSPSVRKTGGEVAYTTSWTEMEASLHEYRTGIKLGKAERATCIQTGFVPKFRQEELSAILSGARLSRRQRELLFDWVDVLFEDLQGAPANRGACLDGIATVIESRLMSYFVFETDTSGRKRLQQTIASLLYFAIDKLNGKAIFANTLGFAGKMLAAAFWNLDGVALRLLRLLPAVKKQHLLRIVKEAGVAECPGTFPPHLDNLSFDGNAAKYMHLFPPVRPGTDEDTFLYQGSFDAPLQVAVSASPGPDMSSVSAHHLSIEMSGNWLIRWTATDSDLPFAFMRAYHRQLSNYLPAFDPSVTALDTKQMIKAPGYIFVMGCLLEVCDALIHRNLRSVTTMAPSNTGVNANESANLAAGQKPKALEVVSKRVVQTIFEVVGGLLQFGPVTSTPQAFASAALRHNFGASLRIWIAAITKRTSMYDTRGIFALLDLIEGLIFNICSPPLEPGKEEDEDEVWQPSEVGLALFDTGFVLSFIKTILSKADNTTCLLRTISFLYTEFASFTLRPEDREELCDHIILNPVIFNRLFLYYNVGVRGYFLRLLVYRLARLGAAEEGKAAWSIDPRILATLRNFENRLEKIRKRHDELDPYNDEWDSEDSEDEFRPRPKRSTICSTWGVHDQPWAIDSFSRKPSLEATQEEREAELSMQNATVEAIEEPVVPMMSPPLLLTPSANSSTTTLAKANKLAAAKKVAGGWWSNLKNRKTSGNQNKSKPSAYDTIVPYEDTTHTSASDSWERDARPLPPAPLSLPVSLQDAAHSSDMQDDAPKDVPAQLAPAAVHPILPPQVPEFLKVETGAGRLRKSSTTTTRKSIRRGAAGGAAAGTPSRSRRSSMYSFDLDVNTPRSDAFDFPMSPLSANGASPLSPADGTVGALGLSPVAFSALMDGAITFGSDDIAGVASPSRPRHSRHKSASSVRKSRPTSVISERGGPSPRVSKRFSKRASILPPPALDLLKESPSEPVPKIPEQYKTPTTGNTQTGMFASGVLLRPQVDRAPSPPPYEQKQHAYAVRGLREYEDCLDEWELFVHRAKEEEGADGKELNALIPRLQCAWPSTWEE